ncbi:MAG: hypothetical protein REI96_09975 [Flavobacterium nitrogenifigens]|uniref:hypothetical protein n=1 Tax=Flavobacterium nitrogenifigens TaxID=1617283 RepID=UPI0028094710|nr:hypothetical protein [Flavobacterium nitrogenifigens]MDQ8012764.1 hypothetical protein [Flavobacterium nitrogenifigens]
MKNTLVLIVLLSTFQFFGQNNQKIVFQKNKYELAVAYYKKADFVKAIDLFSLAANIKPDSEIGIDAVNKVDTLRKLLRKKILNLAVGTWKRIGNQPIWSTAAANDNQSSFDELIEIKVNEILFYEVDKKTKEKKLLKRENLVYNNASCTASVFSEIILSDGTIWYCSLNEKSNILHVINVAVKTKEGVQKIINDNEESYYAKI